MYFGTIQIKTDLTDCRCVLGLVFVQIFQHMIMLCSKPLHCTAGCTLSVPEPPPILTTQLYCPCWRNEEISKLGVVFLPNHEVTFSTSLSLFCLPCSLVFMMLLMNKHEALTEQLNQRGDIKTHTARPYLGDPRRQFVT